MKTILLPAHPQPTAFSGLLQSLTRYMLVAVLSLAARPALAQKATVSNDTVYRNGAAYALVHTSGTESHPNFSFRTLEGEEFMMMNYDDAAGDYRIVFFPGEEQTRLHARYGSVGVMAQEVVDNRLVESGALNPAGLKRFMLAHPPSASTGVIRAKTTSTSGNTGAGGTTSSTREAVRKLDDEIEAVADDVSEAVSNIGAAVERAFEKDSLRRAERRAKEPAPARLKVGEELRLTATGTELHKNGSLIATYAQSTATNGSTVFTIRAPGGTTVARATVPKKSPKSAKIMTIIDDRSSTLPLYGRTSEEDATDIGYWLLAQGYL